MSKPLGNRSELAKDRRSNLIRYTTNTVKALGIYLGASLIIGGAIALSETVTARQNAHDIGACLDVMGNSASDRYIINLGNVALSENVKWACSRALGLSVDKGVGTVAVNPDVMRNDLSQARRDAHFNLFPEPFLFGAAVMAVGALSFSAAELISRRSDENRKQ